MKPVIKFFVSVLTTCLLINVFVVITISAQPVDSIQAKLVARNFFADRLSWSKLGDTKGISFQDIEVLLVYKENKNIIKKDEPSKGSQNLPLYYVFNVKNKSKLKDKNGFIIVSADQRVPVVLGYSFTDEFSLTDQAPAFKAWMKHYEEQIADAIRNNIKAAPVTTDQWKKYSGTTGVKGTKQLTEVLPLLTTKWSQRSYYNNLCPADANCTGSLNGHVPAGCTAVAMAQIMKYHNYPAANNPIPGYSSANYGWQADIGATTYNWTKMLNSADLSAPPAADVIEAVSTLIYHCGVAVQMNYGPPPTGSGAGSPLNAFVTYFKYSPDIQEISKSDFSDDDWDAALRNELDNNRPVYYAGYGDDNYGGGHAFVCDGYQSTDYFHFAWGFGGGGANGYFYLNDLTPGTGTDNYTFKQWADIGIKPDQNATVSDAEGNRYNVVNIGNQTWMAENLKTRLFNDGTAIAYPGTDINAWQGNSTGAYAWWGDNEANRNIYGALYNWHAVNTGILCPVGWHVPTFNDWLDLMAYLGNGSEYDGRLTGGGLLKETGTAHWKPANEGASDAYGFKALPGGNRTTTGTYFHLEDMGAWWASGYWWNDPTKTLGTAFDIFNSSAGVWYGSSEKNVGLSVRCLKGVLVEDIKVDAGAYTYGDINKPGEEKWYRFLTEAAGSYAIQTTGTTDTYMYLYAGDQTTVLAEDNDGAGSGHNSRIVQNLNANTLYYIKIKGNDNTVTGSYYIGINALPAPPVAINTALNYDGSLHSASASVPAGNLIVWYDAASEGNVTTAPSGTNAGTYTAWAEAINDKGYSSASRTLVTLTIKQLQLTIKANDATKFCGQKNPAFSVIYDGFAAGENESVLEGALSFRSSANEDSGTGTYSVTPAGLISANYNISYYPGILTVMSASIDASASSLPVPVGSGSITLTAKTSGSDLTPLPDVKVWFSLENGFNQVTYYPAVFTNSSGIARLTLDGLASVTDVFKVTATAGTGCGPASVSVAYLAVYDPTGGFITGGGWINSPKGAYLAEPELTGKANFGFVSKYKKGTNQPDGNTEFQFNEGNLNFSSSSYDVGSLVIAGYKAIYKGEGTINKTGSYKFMVSASDGDIAGSGGLDRFRIRIWNKTDNAIVYDNNLGRDENDVPLTALGGGSIIIHKPANTGPKSNEMAEFDLKVYPNPFTDHISFDLQLKKDSKISLELFDIYGAKIATIYNGVVIAFNHYEFEYSFKNVSSGTIFYRLTVDGKLLFNGNLIHY